MQLQLAEKQNRKMLERQREIEEEQREQEQLQRQLEVERRQYELEQRRILEKKVSSSFNDYMFNTTGCSSNGQLSLKILYLTALILKVMPG